MTGPERTATADLLRPGWTRQSLQRRTLVVLVAAQLLSGAGLAAGVTVGALLAEDMLGSTALAGLPIALFTAGSAAAALLIGRVSARHGRRPGLALGYAAGALGGVGVVVAAAVDNVPLLLIGITVYGSGTATNLQARYAGADLAEPAHRGRAVSIVLVATTAGAVAGPNLTGLTGDLAAGAGLPRLAGPFVLAAVAYALSAAVLFALLRPDPLLTAAALAADAAHHPSDGSTVTSTSRRVVTIAAGAMVLTQVAMVAIMTMTPVHLRAHGHDVDAVGLVIAVHVACMFLPSPLTGWLADRYGRYPVLVGAGVMLVAAGLVGAWADPGSVWLLALALGLLGLGWNLGLVGGTALVTDATALGDRARTQGAVDLTIALAGATGGLASGAVVAAGSYPLLSLLGGAAGLLMLPALLVATRARPTSARMG